jgi:hypothetical protein
VREKPLLSNCILTRILQVSFLISQSIKQDSKMHGYFYCDVHPLHLSYADACAPLKKMCNPPTAGL